MHNRNEYKHISVLLQESVDGLNIKANGTYIDGTYGFGGHSKLILSKLNKNGKLIAIDRDPYAVAYAKKSIFDKRFSIKCITFSQLESLIKRKKLIGKINGILLDLGISSMQLDNPNRGFSFIHDGPLDMRMNPTIGQSAYEWLIKATENEIFWVLKTYGEERFAKKIAKTIVLNKKNFKQNELQSTTKLANLIKTIIPYKKNNKHPATKTFQAIRIHINNELEEINVVLKSSLKLLAPLGRLSIISFHSLEDRIVKQFIRLHSSKQNIHRSSATSQIESQYFNIPILKMLGKKNQQKQKLLIIHAQEVQLYVSLK